MGVATRTGLDEIMRAFEQLFVGEKYEVYMSLRRDAALKEYREIKRNHRERIRPQADGKRRAA